MKIPAPPLDSVKLLDPAQENWGKISGQIHGPLAHGKYLHWDQLLHLPPPPGLTLREWWQGLKFFRMGKKRIPLRDKKTLPFGYLDCDPIPEMLHKIDFRAGGRIEMADPIANPETRDRYLISSLIEEAITSSQLEGASTTRLVAKEMLRDNRPPVDRHERMILNNYRTMRRLDALKGEPLTPELVFEIHRLITHETHSDPTVAGRFRRADEKIQVIDESGRIIHEPPPAAELDERLRAMCDFANGQTPEGFVHPVIRSIILHFWLAYDHPFVDGNGRTARALCYWSMLRHGYWLFEFISISRILLKAPSQYARAYFHTETDDNDLTYFIIFQLEVIGRAIAELHAYIERKTNEIKVIERNLRGVSLLNTRQRALIGHALLHPRQRYTIRGHQGSHGVVYETARKDLLNLVERGLLSENKIGKTFYFTPPRNLEKKLAAKG